MSLWQPSPGGATHLPPEIAFLLAGGVEARLLARAADLARQAGTDAATALLQAGLIDEDGFYRALAQALGVPFLAGPIPFGKGLRYPDCLVAGLAPLAPGAPASHVLAPRGRAVAELLAWPGPQGEFAITTPTRLRRAVFAAIPGTVAAHAADDLRRRDPDQAPAPSGRRLLPLALTLAALACLWMAAPPLLALSGTVAIQILFLALITPRVAALAISPPPVTAPPLPDADLPVYTILVALYREHRVVPRLVLALGRLDYPAAKLDIKFLIEEDDRETAQALARVPLPARFEVVTVPPGQPRTKPRALNAALPLVRGDLLVVYDAEDVFERDQLRKAAAIFAQEPADTACLQGRLVIDDHGDGLRQKLFALEYAALFDVVNPALAALDLPIPLGGTTMHVRTKALRELAGWNSWNVTEDADLGIRLALAGYRVGDLPSATFEETAGSWRAWLAQRIRWQKGFLQTSLIHGRRPLSNAARLGPLRTLGALAMVPGTVVSALIYPFGVPVAALAFALGWVEPAPGVLGTVSCGLAATLFIAGLVAMIGPAALACRRRGWHDLYPVLPLLPLYYLGMSVAAWLAVIELVCAPHRWNKTEHGLAHTSRSGRLMGAAALSRVARRSATDRPSGR